MPSRVRWAKLAGMACAAAVAAVGIGWLLYAWQKPRVLRLNVYTDYAFRQNHSDWDRIIRERIAALNGIYGAAGVRWELASLDQADPTIARPGMDLRRRKLSEAPGPPADLLLGLAGSTEGADGGGVLPFTHAAMVLDDTGEFAAEKLARELSRLFGAPPEKEQPGVALSPAAQTLVRRLRDYDFEHGTEALAGDAGARAVDAIADAWRKTAPNPEARAHALVAASLIAERRLDAGVAHLRQALKLDPKDASARLTLAAALTESGDFAGASAVMRDGVSADPANDRLRAGAAALEAKASKPPEALLQLMDEPRRHPNDAELNVVFGWLFLPEEGLINESVAAFENARNADPFSPSALRGLERADIVRQTALMDVERRREGVRQKPENPDAHFSLGVAYLLAGELDSSVREFERVVALKPSSGRAHSNLAVLYCLKREYPDAQREVAAARKAGVEPSNDLARAIQQAAAR